MVLFCPKCGATDKDFFKGFCIDCYSQTHVSAEFPRKVVIAVCKRCGNYRFKDEWLEEAPELFEKIVASGVKTNLFFPVIHVRKQARRAEIALSGFVDEKKVFPVGKTALAELEFRELTCENCMRVTGNYFEVELQIRRLKENHNPVLFRQLVSFVKKETHSLAGKDLNARAFWWQDSRDGTDFYFGYKQVGMRVYNGLLAVFGRRGVRGDTKSYTFKGFTRAGKKKIRATLCVRA